MHSQLRGIIEHATDLGNRPTTNAVTAWRKHRQKGAITPQAE
jgi:hypothetical protein